MKTRLPYSDDPAVRRKVTADIKDYRARLAAALAARPKRQPTARVQVSRCKAAAPARDTAP